MISESQRRQLATRYFKTYDRLFVYARSSLISEALAEKAVQKVNSNSVITAETAVPTDSAQSGNQKLFHRLTPGVFGVILDGKRRHTYGF